MELKVLVVEVPERIRKPVVRVKRPRLTFSEKAARYLARKKFRAMVAQLRALGIDPVRELER